MPRYLLVLASSVGLVLSKPNLLSSHENSQISLDDDKTLEEFALMQRNAKRFKTARKLAARRTENLEDVSPGLNKWLLNTTDAEDLPHWKKQLLEMEFLNPDNSEKFERGTFSLPEWLKKQGDVMTKTEDLPKIYLCQERKRDPGDKPCCIGKDTECFTDGGCFCDESCQQYDDCCPDYDSTCMEILSLCLLTPAPPPAGPPKAPSAKDPTLRKVGSSGNKGTGGGAPVRLEPNKCCGARPYNDGERCCCDGELVDAACDDNPCN